MSGDGISAMSAIRVMIAENESAQHQALSGSLAAQEGLEIISTVSTRETAIKQLTGYPDILLLDPELLKEHTLSRFIRSVHTKSPHTRVLQLLNRTLADENLIFDTRSGIRGYVKIPDPPAIMIKAICAVHEGKIWAERRVLEKAISKPMILPETIQSQVPGLPPLTNREVEMLTMVMQGASNREIANSSSISERTVKTHLYRVYRKLKVKSRTKAIALLAQS